MKGIKKITALISVAVLAVSLAACGASGNQDVGGTDIGSVDTGSAEAGSGDAENTGTDSTGTDSTGTDAESQRNILVAYFSYTGNTEEVAKQIAEQTGGDRVQIERSVPYDDVQTEARMSLRVMPGRKSQWILKALTGMTPFLWVRSGGMRRLW